VEVGCGTGDVIGMLNDQACPPGLPGGGRTAVPCIGIDINKDFIDFCQERYQDRRGNGTSSNASHCEFHLADALHLVEWYESNGLHHRYSKPLVICVNNTLNIMPQAMRGAVIDQMLELAGRDGLCMVSYWNGNFFSHAVMNYYQKNQPLCGVFDVHQHVDWDNRILVTPTNYSTHWQTPQEVQLLLRSYDVDVPNMERRPLFNGQPHIHCDGLAIFVWFNQTSTSRAKGYYDSDDAQKFYHGIWGENELHVGRFDLLTDQERQTLTLGRQIRRAEELHELELVRLIKSHTPGADHSLRVVDLGCGYGGILRRLWKEGLVWRGVGCDISHKMCLQARERNAAVGADRDIDILEESYLQLSVNDESADLVISMDALLHVGPDRQRQVMKEAARILRPGGWIIFSDIMQEETVANAELMQPIYDRINLSKMGTVSNYQDALETCGFSNFMTELHSDNIPIQYGNILTALEERGDELGLSRQYQDKAKKGLQVWRDNSPGNIVWGFVAAQKTRKVDLSKVNF
jgi:sarcosine/dimethylglycine N-methyltransferase